MDTVGLLRIVQALAGVQQNIDRALQLLRAFKANRHANVPSSSISSANALHPVPPQPRPHPKSTLPVSLYIEQLNFIGLGCLVLGCFLGCFLGWLPGEVMRQLPEQK